jgi:hypothetical protein
MDLMKKWKGRRNREWYGAEETKRIDFDDTTLYCFSSGSSISRIAWLTRDRPFLLLYRGPNTDEGAQGCQGMKQYISLLREI